MVQHNTVKTNVLDFQQIRENMMDDLTWATKVANLLKQLNDDLEDLEKQRGKTVQQEVSKENK